MSIVALQLPDVKRKTEIRPGKCHYCQRETLQCLGKVGKPVRVSQYWSVQASRYRCCNCRRTFRHCPEGIDRADQIQRLRKLAANYWMLGLSLREVAIAMTPFGVKLSHMTIWRDLQAQAEHLDRQRRWQVVRALGLDGPYVQGWDQRKHPVLVG